MSLSTITLYSSNIDDVAAITMIIAVTCYRYIPSPYMLVGKKGQYLLAKPQRLKIFNSAMLSLLVLSVGFSL